MYRDLADLKQRVNDLIATYGEDACVAVFIFSPADVFVWTDRFCKINENCDDQYLSDEDVCEVLYKVGRNDYINEVIGEYIDDEVYNLKLKQSIKK
ncbi:hypothetical protein EB118_17990 [bacterium]|nr:hypothetical protein [bacterium]